MSFFKRCFSAASLAALTIAAPMVALTLSAATPAHAAENEKRGYSEDEVVNEVANFFGVTAEAAGQAVAKVFKENGEPVGFIKGEEASGAIGVGLRYGKGTMFLHHDQGHYVYWQGPSIGFDTGGNASKVFTLIYGMDRYDQIYQRFPGVEGSAYLVAGIGVNYQRANNITLAPMRAGVGLRLGANIGYLAYTRERHVLPF